MQNVLFISGLGGDTRRYRCEHHQEQLALHGIASTLRAADDLQLYVDITTHDLIIMHRAPYSDLVRDLIEIAHLRGKPVLFETDDLIFEPQLYEKIAFLDTLSPEAAHRFRQDLYAQAKTFAESDYVLTTTGFLADAAARHGKTVFIQRNAFSAEMIQAAEAAYALNRNDAQVTDATDHRPVVIGYFSGTGSHNRDFASITPALLEIMARYPQIWLHVSGHLELEPRFQLYQARIRRAAYVAWRELPNLIAQVDINLAPLELDNPFCQAKSEIKYTEAALVGVPTVASPTDAFVYAIQDGENGLLADTSAAWVSALSRLIEDPRLRRRLGEQARARVYRDYTPQVRSQTLVETLQQIEANDSTSAADPAQVAPTVARAMKRRLDSLVQQQQQQATQLLQLRETVTQWAARPVDPAGEFWRQSLVTAEQQHLENLRELLSRLQKRVQ